MNDILIDNTDAAVWAHEFVKTIENDPQLALDEGVMIGWFANAIDNGRTAGQNQQVS